MTVTEAELKAAAVAPRVTLEDVQDSIVSEQYFTANDGAMGAALNKDRLIDPDQGLGLLTFCVLTLRNGWTITGESACASPANFNPEIGRKLAKDSAVSKVWAFLGFELKTKLSQIEAVGKPSGQILTLGSPRTAVGTKVVHFIAMTLGEYNLYRGWDIPACEDPEKNGYMVEYTDGGEPNMVGHKGYVSWSPRDVFEKSYDTGVRQVPETFMDRLIAEMGRLGSDVSKLRTFVEGESFNKIPEEEQVDLQKQFALMVQYLDVLSRRVARNSQ